MSNEIMFAVMGAGGLLGAGEKYYPIPWNVLNYDSDKDAYVVAFSSDALKQAPVYRREDLTRDDGAACAQATTAYYSSLR